MQFEWKSLNLDICSYPEYGNNVNGKTYEFLDKPKEQFEWHQENIIIIYDIKLQKFLIEKMWPGIKWLIRGQRSEENGEKWIGSNASVGIIHWIGWFLTAL